VKVCVVFVVVASKVQYKFDDDDDDEEDLGGGGDDVNNKHESSSNEGGRDSDFNPAISDDDDDDYSRPPAPAPFQNPRFVWDSFTGAMFFVGELSRARSVNAQYSATNYSRQKYVALMCSNYTREIYLRY